MACCAEHTRLANADKRARLARVIERCAPLPGKPPAVVVFDLDGTVFDNRPRTAFLLREVAESWRGREPEAASMLSKASPEGLVYVITESIERYGVTRTDLVAEAEAHWREGFFGDDYLGHDVPVAGAPAYAWACYEAGAVCMYLTGRDLPRMALGSLRSLRDHGFPIGLPGTELVLKPDPDMLDDEFKRLSAPRLGRVGRVVASFDNEPTNCNVFARLYGDCATFLVDTQHPPNAPPLDARVGVIGDYLLATP